MFKRAIPIAMSFVGVVVGAGFASGQEMLQYFVAFGGVGRWGAVLAGAVMMAAGAIVLAYGSYLRAKEHLIVFDRMALPITSKILDAAVLFTLFSTGFVMLAGAGSNLNQQFGLPTLAGSVIMLILVLLTGFLDVDAVSKVIGAITPFIMIFLVGAGVYVLLNTSGDSAVLEQASAQVSTNLPNWWISALNYVGMSLMVGISMAIVIGGTNLMPRAAAVGGLMGGTVWAVLVVLLVFALYQRVDEVYADDMPLLTIVTQVHPMIGNLMAIVVFGMIFNTAIGMFYAMAKRITRKKPENFRKVYFISVLIGFAFSFIPFTTLVGIVYPISGYIGIVLIFVMFIAWFRGRVVITEESSRRARIRDLLSRKLDPRRRFTRKHAAQLKKDIKASNIDDKELNRLMYDDVLQELDDDDEVDVDRDVDLPPEIEKARAEAKAAEEADDKK
ncbi:YkvI family membrane protein [Corynebacterium sp. 335C]